ncbi:MAG: Flp family type IVb pilin [Candidatus Brocadiaceae bacterium]|nr:Flp family type IVb pilin [Candidatus Brocadiaceae bacterium]
MSRLMFKVWMALRSKKGQSLVEYALILALVAIVVIVALTALGGSVEDKFVDVTNTLDNSTSGG